MRLADVEDFVRRAGLDEFVQHLAAVELRVLDLTVELAVAEQAGAAFTELHVRRRVQPALAPQAPGLLGALAHRLDRKTVVSGKSVTVLVENGGCRNSKN